MTNPDLLLAKIHGTHIATVKDCHYCQTEKRLGIAPKIEVYESHLTKRVIRGEA